MRAGFAYRLLLTQTHSHYTLSFSPLSLSLSLSAMPTVSISLFRLFLLYLDHASHPPPASLISVEGLTHHQNNLQCHLAPWCKLENKTFCFLFYIWILSM